MLDIFSFLRPSWLLLLPFVLGLWWLEHYRQAATSAWNDVCDTRLIEVLLLDKTTSSGNYAAHHVIALLSLIAVIALAGPSWQKEPDRLLRSKAALFIAFDLSNSMLVHDINPARYIRARFKIEDLLNQHRKGDVSLIAYASNAYPVTPLTHDVENLKALVPSLSPRIMPGRGSNTQAVFTLARELLDRSNLEKGDVLLVTDGIGNANVDELIQFAEEARLRVSVLGVGTKEGDAIPAMNDIDQLRDKNGVLIQSRLAEDVLETLAKRTRGMYQQVRADADDINQLSVFLNKTDNQHRDSDEQGEQESQDNGIWLVLLCLPLALYLFRKNLLFVLLIGLMHIPSEPLQAADFNDWFVNNNQKGKQAFDDTQYRDSLRLFDDIRWRAASAFRLNDWQKAYDLYMQLDDVESIYNRGNALVYLARLEEAILAYNEVLKREPGHEDAQFNKNEVLKLLEKLSGEKESEAMQAKGEQDDKQQQKKSDNKEKQEGSESNKKPPPKSGEQAESQKSAGDSDDMPLENSTAKPSDSDDANSAEVSDMEREIKEDELAEDQWLRRIKDDPAGLMRRKFREKYKQQDTGANYSGDPW